MTVITPQRPGTLSRGPLRAFWLMTSLVVGAAAGAATRGRASIRLTSAVGVAVLTAYPGVAHPHIVRPPFLAWEAAARRTAGMATTYAAWVMHVTAFPPRDRDDRWNGERHGARPASTWQPRGTQQRAAFASPSLTAAHAEARTSLGMMWASIRDGSHARPRWLCTCLALLRWLDSQDRPDADLPVADNYSLR